MFCLKFYLFHETCPEHDSVYIFSFTSNDESDGTAQSHTLFSFIIVADRVRGESMIVKIKQWMIEIIAHDCAHLHLTNRREPLTRIGQDTLRWSHKERIKRIFNLSDCQLKFMFMKMVVFLSHKYNPLVVEFFNLSFIIYTNSTLVYNNKLTMS
jgi:hypothetical protein